MIEISCLGNIQVELQEILNSPAILPDVLEISRFLSGMQDFLDFSRSSD